MLLEAGAEPNCANEDGFTRLMLAAMGNHLAVVRVLLSSGADPFARGKFGQTARDIALSHGRHEIISAINASLNQQTDEGE